MPQPPVADQPKAEAATTQSNVTDTSRRVRGVEGVRGVYVVIGGGCVVMGKRLLRQRDVDLLVFVSATAVV